ncbi:TerC family protein [Effusibacillus consociatus]|uniref:TerC family protein n=1 Tax=Effusibacillus consociatus TaxID=1117041 RepID=A0ABV9Q464_9BACL
MDVGFFADLLKIIIINLVLSGDNAIVIALASRNLPDLQRKKAIGYGTLGAVVLRILLTFVVVWILKIPFLMVIGGLLLVWISYKLLVNKEENVDIKAGANLFQAVQTIIVADLVMSLDNVLAVAAAAKGNFWLLVIGIALSIPIIVWGSTLILKLIEKYPAIIYIGAGILAYTAGEMLISDKNIEKWVHAIPGSHYLIPILTAVVVLAVAFAVNRRERGPVKQEGVSNTP